MEFIDTFLNEAIQVIQNLDRKQINAVINVLSDVRNNNGRIFFLGVGGSAANASHAVNDFRKITGIESYAPTDNVSELTARTNDDGWSTVFSSWLETSKLRSNDLVFVLSVGGGNLINNVSPNIVTALQYAKQKQAKIVGIVGRDGGYTAEVADAHILIPTINAVHTTPHCEAFQAVIWHLLVSHPKLKALPTKWESVIENAI